MFYSTRSEDHRKGQPSLWHYIKRYRRHFRSPLILSFIAVFVNVPAFFEIDAIECYLMPEMRMGYGVRLRRVIGHWLPVPVFLFQLQISKLRLNTHYKLWYKVVFRMLVTSCGPNVFILCLTILTVVLLRRSNRSRKKLFDTNESTITSMELYSNRATMLTMISVMLVAKFLLFRSLSFVLDIWEVTFGLRHRVHHYIYLVDISNFLIILNSATNALIIYRASRWLHAKLAERSTLKNKRGQLGFENLSSKRKLQLIRESWDMAVKQTNGQFGNRILYAILLKNPQMFTPFKESTSPTFHTSTNVRSVKGIKSVSWGRSETKRNLITEPEDSGSSCALITTSTSLHSHLHSEGVPRPTPKVAIVTPLLREDIRNNGLESEEETGSEVEQSAGASSARAVYPAPIDVGAMLTAIPHVKKKSIELLSSAKFHAIGQMIMRFIGEVIDMMGSGGSEQAISTRIQQVGRVHFNLGIVFPSSAWREFKSKSLAIIADCEFPSEKEKVETLEVWSSLLSNIIREMKMGMWAGEDHKSSLAAGTSLSTNPSLPKEYY